MTWAAAAFLVLSFLGILRLLRVLPRVAEVLQRSRLALAEIRSTALSDDEKEKAMRAHSARLLALFLLLTASMLLALLLPLGVVALLDVAGVIVLDEVLDRLLSWQLLVAGVAVGVAVLAFPRRGP